MIEKLDHLIDEISALHSIVLEILGMSYSGKTVLR